MRTKLLVWSLLSVVSGCTFHTYSGSTVPQRAYATADQPRLVTERQFAGAEPRDARAERDHLRTTSAERAPAAPSGRGETERDAQASTDASGRNTSGGEAVASTRGGGAGTGSAAPSPKPTEAKVASSVQSSDSAVSTDAKVAVKKTAKPAGKRATKPKSSPAKVEEARVALARSTKAGKSKTWRWRQDMSESDALGLPQPERHTDAEAEDGAGSDAAAALRRANGASRAKDRTESLAPSAPSKSKHGTESLAPSTSPAATGTMQLASSQRGSAARSDETMTLER